MKFSRVVLLTLVLLTVAGFLSACGFSMAEDITPPPGAEVQAVVTVQPTAPQNAGPMYPLVAPDPANGKAIYEEECLPCHGSQGLGDGPQAAQLPNPPSPLGQVDFARQFTPAEWYAVVTNGRIDKFMPPFAGLSDGERWDVVAYAFTLSAPADVLTRGETLFAENCARCHGESGNGDGPDAAQLSDVAVFTDQAFMARLSAEDMAAVMTNGQGDMPAFGDKLSQEDIWALTVFLRSLSFADKGALAVEPQATPAVTVSGTLTVAMASPTPEHPLGVVRGAVTNGSTEASAAPAGLTVTLYVIENMAPVFTETTTLDENGVYAFEDLEILPERLFVTTVSYAGATYGSDIGAFQDGDDVVELPVTIFEPTHDTSVLSVDRLHIFFDFNQPDVVQVIELYVISNNSNQTLVPSEPDGGVVPFTLPEGAGEPQFQDGVLGGRYLPTADGFMDTLTVHPGQGQYQVLYATTLPYNKKITFRQSYPIKVDATLFMVPDGIKLKGAGLEDSGTRDVQGAIYRTYTGKGLSAGSTFEATISGKAGGESGISLADGSSSSLAIGLGAFGVVLIGVGIWFYRQTREQEEDEEPSDDLSEMDDPQTVMDAIIALDDLYKEGDLPEDAYRARRAALKEHLKDLLDEDHS